MTTDLAIVLALLGASFVMFLVNRPRMDGVALLMVVALPLTATLSVERRLPGWAIRTSS